VVVPRGLNAAGEAVCEAVAALGPGPLVVALSGGADSAVVAWACATTRPAGSVSAVYVDHGWPDSARLRMAAEEIASKVGLPLEVIAVEQPPGPSPEGRARSARLAALAAAAGKARIVTGHHADDSAETVVGNLLRGAGLTGLSGIAMARDPFLRPLIGFRRRQIRKLAEELDLPFFDDPSNADTTLTRNLIRNEILPELDRHVAGDPVDVIARSARHLAAADDFLADLADPVPVGFDGEAWLLPTAPLTTLPAVLAERAVRDALRAAHPPYPGSTREVDAVLAVAAGQAPRTDLADGLVVEHEGPYVAVYSPLSADIPDAVQLDIPGSVVFGKHRLLTRRTVDGSKARLSNDWCRLHLAGEALVVRSPQAGDRIDIGAGTKTVADALGEAAVPRRKRSAWPVIESRGRIAWLAGVRVAAWARTESSAGLWVECERQDT
jgi:tRNA(Ile)-lysidine synthase